MMNLTRVDERRRTNQRWPHKNEGERRWRVECRCYTAHILYDIKSMTYAKLINDGMRGTRNNDVP